MTTILTPTKHTVPAINFRTIPIQSTAYEPRVIEFTLPTIEHIRVFHDMIMYFDGIMAGEFSPTEVKLVEKIVGALNYTPTTSDVKMWFHNMLSPAIKQDMLFSLESIIKRLQATNITPLDGHYVKYSMQPTPCGVQIGLKLTSVHHGIALAYLMGSQYRVCNHLNQNATPQVIGMKYAEVYTAYQSFVHPEHWSKFIATVLQPQIDPSKVVV